LKIDHFREAVAIAQCGGMRAAGRFLDVAQPLLARNLHDLEQEIGGALFTRQPRGMTPTALGEEFIAGARRVLREIARMREGLGMENPRKSEAMGNNAKTEIDRNRTGRVFIDLVLETFRLNGRLLTYGDELLKPIQLTSSRWQVLGSLPRNRATVSEIARYMGLQRQSIQRTIDALCKEGLVRLEDNPKHRRAKLAVLTKQGREAIAQAGKVRDRWAKRTTADLTDGEMEAAYQVLRHIRLKMSDPPAAAILTGD
jgi:DNA-binding MarR family transcriptional regulator